MYVSQEIAERIKDIAKCKGVQLKDMFSALGIGSNTMQNMKTSMPKTDTIARIADYLDVSVDYLLGRETKTPPEFLTLRATRDEWAEILNSMTDENLIRLRDYAKLLLLQQAQAEQEGQESL